MTTSFIAGTTTALAGSVAGVVAVSIDPTLYAAAVVTVIAALTTAIVTIINAWTGANGRRILSDKADTAAGHALEAATAAAVVADKADATDKKIDAIKASAEGAERNSNGVLTAMRADLAKSQEHNRTLLATIATLTDLLKTAPRSPRAGDVQKVEVVNDPLTVAPAEGKS